MGEGSPGEPSVPFAWRERRTDQSACYFEHQPSTTHASIRDSLHLLRFTIPSPTCGEEQNRWEPARRRCATMRYHYSPPRTNRPRHNRRGAACRPRTSSPELKHFTRRPDPSTTERTGQSTTNPTPAFIRSTPFDGLTGHPPTPLALAKGWGPPTATESIQLTQRPYTTTARSRNH